MLTAIMQFLLSLLQAKGFYLFSMLATLFASAIKIFLVFTLTVQANINIFALPLSNIFLAGTVCIFALIKLKGLVTFPFFNFALPLLSAVIMFMLVKILLGLFGNVWGLIFAIVVGGAVYIALVLPLVLEYVRGLLQKKRQEKG